MNDGKTATLVGAAETARLPPRAVEVPGRSRAADVEGSGTAALIYRSAFLYWLLMRVLYGRHYAARYEAVAAQVPWGAEVLDVCAGDCRLARELAPRGVRYVALDRSPALVRSSRLKGVDARIFDLWRDPLPVADVVVLQASLYQFTPAHQLVLDHLLSAARRLLIVAEPVRNVSTSRLRPVAALARALTRPPGDDGYTGDRFSLDELRGLFGRQDSLIHMLAIPGGRELVGVFRGGAHGALRGCDVARIPAP